MNAQQTLNNYAKENGKKLTYNRSTGEYQIINGFYASKGEFPFVSENGKLLLSNKQCEILRSYV